MRKLIFTLSSFIFTAAILSAQPLKDEYKGVYRIYDFDAPRVNAPAPKGYEVFAISHYGRHGSRLLYSEADYDSLYVVLNREKLTPYGEQVKEKFMKNYPDFIGNAADLTELGQEQHRLLARRMCADFPQLFKKDSDIYAVSSDKSRCFMSMYAFLDELRLYKSTLNIKAHYSTALLSVIRNRTGKQAFPIADYLKANYNPKPLFERLFVEPEAAMARTDAYTFGQRMFYYASHLEGAGKADSFWDSVLTDSEIAEIFKVENEKFSYNRGSLIPGNVVLAKYTLEYLVNEAEKDIASSNTMVRLRFGHDTVIMNLMALLELTPCDKGRIISSDVPMASNVRFVFARNKAGEVLVKYQYNETDIMPWTPWAEFKAYCLERINWNPKQHNLLEKNSEYNPMFIAHRGLQSMGPENSLPSFKAAAEKGMWAIETDFRITADGQVVCIHDMTLERTTDGQGAVADMTLEQIRTLKLKPVNTKTVKQLYDYEHMSDADKVVPTMDEYFQICKEAGAVAFIELKEDKGVIKAMIEAIEKYGMKGSCVISSGNLALLEKYRAAGGKETIHLIFAKPEQIAKVKELGNASVSFKYSDLDAQVDLTIDGVHLTSFKQIVDHMHNNGIKICFRAADSADEARKHLALGVDYMPTNVTYTL